MKTIQSSPARDHLYPSFITLESGSLDPARFRAGETHVRVYGRYELYLSFDFSVVEKCPFCGRPAPRVLDFHNEAYFVCCGSTVSLDQAGYVYLCERLPEDAQVMVEIFPRECPGSCHKYREGEVPRTSCRRYSFKRAYSGYRRRSLMQRMRTAVDQIVISFSEREEGHEDWLFGDNDDVLRFQDSRAHRLMKNQVRERRSRRSDGGKGWKKHRGNRQWQKRFRRHFDECLTIACFEENVEEGQAHNLFARCFGKNAQPRRKPTCNNEVA